MNDSLERAFVKAVSLPALSHTTGRLADLRVPGPVLRRFIAAFVRAYDVDMSQVAQPVESFKTFNAFFTRALVEGARPVDQDPEVIVSPADSRVHEVGRIPQSGMLEQIKGRRYRLGALLGDEGDAGAYREGSYANLYLSPRDYHRVHCPVDGHIVGWRHIPGRLYPVNNLALRHVDSLYAVNERIVFQLESARFGPMALVMVGATNVGRITLSFTDTPGTWRRDEPTLVTPPAPVPVSRGDELGRFNLGSTVVLLSADPSLRPDGVLAGEHVLMGRGLWRRQKS